MIAEILVYITEFVRKKLVKFPECKAYYGTMSLEALEEEAAWLLADDKRILPFQLLFRRCYALFDELTERAACLPNISDKRRMEIVNAAIDVKEQILLRVARSTREQVVQLIQKTCNRIAHEGRYKKASQLVLDSVRSYSGTFAQRRVRIVHPGSTRMQ